MATMNSNEGSKTWRPVEASERYAALDLLRGFALFGVLLINLLYFFRVSLFDHILHFHSHAGWVNHTVDLLVTVLVEFKAFDLFALTFGIGVAVQAERAGLRGVRVEVFLVRRFLVLLGFGACHMLLVSNVDILTLYAVCGLLSITLLRLPTAVLPPNYIEPQDAISHHELISASGLLFPRGHRIPLRRSGAASTRISTESTLTDAELIVCAKQLRGLTWLKVAGGRPTAFVAYPYGHKICVGTVPREIDTMLIQHAGQQMGTPPGVRHGTGQPGTAPPMRIPGRGEPNPPLARFRSAPVVRPRTLHPR